MSRAAENDAPVEWQIASGSPVAHAIDTSAPSWRNPDGGRRKSGPRALCGRYPQRNAEHPWFALPVGDDALSAIGRLMGQLCVDCSARVTPPTAGGQS